MQSGLQVRAPARALKQSGAVALLSAAFTLAALPLGHSASSEQAADQPAGGVTGVESAAARVADAHGIDLGLARERAAGDPEVDLVIDRHELDRWLAAREDDPQLFDGLVIGVMLEEADPALAGEAGAEPSDAAAAADLTREQRTAVQRAGGQAARALDEEHASATAADAPGEATPACVSRAPDARPAADEVVVYFACQGDEPAARPERRPARGLTDEVDRVTLALELLDAPSASGGRGGLYSVVDAPASIVADVTRLGSTITVDFDEALTTRGYAASIAASTLFLEQVVNTVLANSSAATLDLTVEGSCTAFWRAMGGDGCHPVSRTQPTNTTEHGS